MASAIVNIQDKGKGLVIDVQATFQKKRGSKISIEKAINMCLEKLLQLGIKPEEIIK